MAGQWWGLLVMAPVAAALWWWQRVRRADPPVVAPAHRAPERIDPDDLDVGSTPRASEGVRAAAPGWYVVLFSSATCGGCAQVWQAAQVLESSAVGVHRFEYSEHRALHEKYRITAVPTLVVTDAAGTVLRSFLGSVSATHLWATVAEVREPGSVPPGCGAH